MNGYTLNQQFHAIERFPPSHGYDGSSSHGDTGCGQDAGTLQEDIDGSGRTAAFIDGPYDQRLSATAITGSKQAGNIGRVLTEIRLVVASRIGI